VYFVRLIVYGRCSTDKEGYHAVSLCTFSVPLILHGIKHHHDMGDDHVASSLNW
jgi:hypothetical protein